MDTRIITASVKEITMLVRVNKLIGHRAPLLNNNGDSVELFSWYHPIYAPAHHLALRITKGQEVHYLSIAPVTQPNHHGCSLFDFRKGTDAYFIASHEDECLIQGFRNQWPAIKKEMTEAQKLLTPDDTLKKISDKTIFEIASQLQETAQAKLRSKGQPQHVIQFCSLELTPMIEKIKHLKSPENNTKYALWSGSKIQEKNTYNCASSALYVLAAGGFGNLMQSNKELFTIAGALLGAAYAFSYKQAWQQAIKNILISTLIARGIDGAMQGYTDIQAYLNYNAAKGKNHFSAAIGFRMLSTILGGFIGSIMPGPIVSTVITLPAGVLALALQAKSEEEARYAPPSTITDLTRRVN
jgi:hypothetical protein